MKVSSGRLVDKDVVLFKEYFDLKDPYEQMSPVIFPRGFTRDYLDGKVSTEKLVADVRKGFEMVASTSDFTLVEGTGHVGVGSIVDLNNAQVARQLGLDIVLIAKAGLGSAFDELALNYAMCQKMGLNVAGVILNRVQEEKREMILNYVTKALKRWNVPLIGAIPYNQLLGTPSMEDFETLLKAPLLSGEEFHYRHFEIMRLVATSVTMFRELTDPNQLIVTPASREDIVEALLELYKGKTTREPDHGFIFTGRFPPSKRIIEKLKRVKIPALYSALPTFETMLMINTFTAKIRKEDTEKVEKAIELVECYLNSSLLMQSPD